MSMGWRPLPVKAQINHSHIQICFLIPVVKEQRRIDIISKLILHHTTSLSYDPVNTEHLNQVECLEVCPTLKKFPQYLQGFICGPGKAGNLACLRISICFFEEGS